MPDFAIRPANLDDASELSAFAARTFSDTFSTLNTSDDMAAHLRSAYSTAQQRAEIASPQMRTLLGERGDRLCAYAQLRIGATPGCVPPSPTIELWRFYMDKSEIGNGTARVLMAAVLDEAAKHAVGTIWLGVWEHNLRAIAFYRKHGFHDIGSHVFRLGSDEQTDLIFCRPLVI